MKKFVSEIGPRMDKYHTNWYIMDPRHDWKKLRYAPTHATESNETLK